MSTNTSRRLSADEPITQEQFDQLLDEFDQLHDRLDEKDDRLDTVESENEALRDRLDTVESELHERLDTVESELNEYRMENEEDKADIRSMATEAQDKIDGNGSVIGKLHDSINAVKNEMSDITTEDMTNPLKQIVRLPDKLAQDSLTKNQNRAREIMTNLTEVETETSMNGRILISSSSIHQYLTEEYGSAHYQTIKRMMNFLDELGSDRAWLKDGDDQYEHKVVLDSDLVNECMNIDQYDPDEIDGLTIGVRPQLSKG